MEVPCPNIFEAEAETVPLAPCAEPEKMETGCATELETVGEPELGRSSPNPPRNAKKESPPTIKNPMTTSAMIIGAEIFPFIFPA